MTFSDMRDPHSFYVPGQPRITHIEWFIDTFDFKRKVMTATANLTFDKSGYTNLDTRGLEILDVWGGDSPVESSLDVPHAMLGTKLSVNVPEGKVVSIEYSTSPEASGIQWMDAKLGGGKPFVYTQGEAINARSYIPCQDTPSIKQTMHAHISTPKRFKLRSLVAASEHVSRALCNNKTYDEEWDMPYPIPSYLIAFAIGGLESREVSHRSRVWALPDVVDAAAEEFKDIERLMQIGEDLFGPYPFGRYDMLVLPPAFPYGGMEHPCLSYLTPALITGDGSGIGTLAHELAHSWTGNLVTNWNWDAFCLNEGPTVWAENRILEVYWGFDAAQVHNKLLEREFEIDCASCRKRNEWYLTKLAPGADDVDPDSIFSRVPYFKGERLLTTIEQYVGRERFDEFMRAWLDIYAFKSATIEMFIGALTGYFGQEVVDHLRIHEWFYEPGLPDNSPAITSPLIDVVEKAANELRIPANDEGWSTEQRQLYLELLPRPLSREFIIALDEALDLRSEPNIEVRWSYLVAALDADHGGIWPDILPDVDVFLHTQGRMKYLKPLYNALAATPKGLAFAHKVFKTAKKNYHPVATKMVNAVLQEAA